MASKRWSVAVTDLTGAAHLHDLTVEADNWMSALRSGRARIGEEGGVPQGASCAVSPEGIVTILDPVSRRKFVLTQRGNVPEAPVSVPAPQPMAPAVAPVAVAAASAPASAGDPGTGKRKKFQTVAFDSGMALPLQPPAEAAPAKQKFQTVAFDSKAVSAALQSAGVAAPAPSAAPVQPAVAVAQASPAAAPTTGVPRPIAANPLAPAAPVAAPSPSTPAQEAGGKRKKFQTVAFDASSMGLQQPQRPAQSAATPQAAAAPVQPVPVVQPAPVKVAAVAAVAPVVQPAPVKVAAAASVNAFNSAAARPSAPSPTRTSAAPAAAPTAAPQAQLLHQRSEDPTPQNPLTYRERSFVIPASVTRATAEAVLRAELAKLKEELAAAKRGKFINLALFDHRWQDRPQRPPVATLQWKDWKGDPELAFPAPPPTQSTPAPAASDDRLAIAFEALQDLPFLSTAAEGLEFAVKLLSDTIPSQAIAACLYDINTDELRVVAAAGPGASERKTQAIPVATGLFGQAARAGDRASVITDVQSQGDFDPGLDSAPGIEPQSMLLRPLIQDGQLFGVLQLINRVGGPYNNEDVNLINYISERVAGFVRQAKLRGRN